VVQYEAARQLPSAWNVDVTEESKEEEVEVEKTRASQPHGHVSFDLFSTPTKFPFGEDDKLMKEN
jgi:hypothetical protein